MYQIKHIIFDKCIKYNALNKCSAAALYLINVSNIMHSISVQQLNHTSIISEVKHIGYAFIFYIRP